MRPPNVEHGWAAFLLAVVLISASPGPAMALIIRRAGLRGWHAAVPVVLGLELGIYVWAVAAAAGAAALVAASEMAFTVLRVAGAGYLILLGILAWRSALRIGGDTGVTASSDRLGWWGRFVEGAVTQLANPKAAVFMLAFYPQFVPRHDPLPSTMVLGLVQVAVETMLYLALAIGVGRAGAWFGRSAVRRWFEAVSGSVLIGLGVRVAAESR